MGFFADFKAKRAATAAAKAHSAALADWEDDRAILTKLITVFTAASKGEDSVPNSLMQKPGEAKLCELFPHTLSFGCKRFAYSY